MKRLMKKLACRAGTWQDRAWDLILETGKAQATLAQLAEAFPEIVEERPGGFTALRIDLPGGPSLALFPASRELYDRLAGAVDDLQIGSDGVAVGMWRGLELRVFAPAGAWAVSS